MTSSDARPTPAALSKFDHRRNTAGKSGETWFSPPEFPGKL
jgi:hypothetical protein